MRGHNEGSVSCRPQGVGVPPLQLIFRLVDGPRLLVQETSHWRGQGHPLRRRKNGHLEGGLTVGAMTGDIPIPVPVSPTVLHWWLRPAWSLCRRRSSRFLP